jgi:hypothetical protein
MIDMPATCNAIAAGAGMTEGIDQAFTSSAAKASDSTSR